MAAKQPKAVPRYCIQHSRFTKQDGWRLDDLSLSLNGNIAVTGCNENTRRTYIDVYTNVRHSDSRDKPKIIYSKEFEKYEDEEWIYYGRIVSFIDDDVLVSCLGDKLKVFQVNKDEVLRSRRVNGSTYCLSVRERREIFIGFYESNKITVYDVIDLNEIKSIILQGIQDGYFPYDMTAIADRIFVCLWYSGEENIHLSLIFEEKSGNILSELIKPTDTSRRTVWGVSVNIPLGVVVIAVFEHNGARQLLMFYSLLSENNCSFLIVESEFGFGRIRISDRGDRIVTGDYRTGKCKVYDMAELITYSHIREKLASTLQTDDCARLAKFFGIAKNQTAAILRSDIPSDKLLLALEEKGILQPFYTDRLREAFEELTIDPFCCFLVELYQKTRAQTTSYGRFLATLSTHLTASLPVDLCDYFNISGKKKVSISSSENPGLSLLLAVDEMGAIKPSDVTALKQPFTEMQLVQAAAKIHEYQSIIEEAGSPLYKKDELTDKEKEDLFIHCLQKKITSWYETMTPVPWKKSCRWKSTDLFTGSNLVMTDKKAATVADPNLADIRIHYTQILSHEKLVSENRIILEGDPGFGKTMLMSQLAYDWCQGKLKEIDMLILLPLRFVEQKTIVLAVKEFYFPQNDRLSLSDIEYFLLHKGVSKCLLLDGLEEYNPAVTLKEQSEVMKVMSGAKYPTCKVVISSRTGYVQNLPECAILKLVNLNEMERNSYIEKVFPDSTEQQNEVKNIIKDNPLILDLCSIPLMFAFTVHNKDCMVRVAGVQTYKVTPFVKSVIDDLGAAGGIGKTGQSELGKQITDEEVLEKLAYNGLCRGHQQLYWLKEFIASNISSIREWIDSGILVMEENVVALPQVRSTAYEKDDVSITGQEEDSGSLPSEAAADKQSDSDSEGKSATKPDVSDVQIKTNHGFSTTAIYVPLQVKFAHKIFQEWFAARHLSSVISGLRNADYLQRYLAERLLHINPSDLRFLLYFTVSLYPPCCHIILKHLLCSGRIQDDKLHKHIMDYIFLCFNEYNGECGHDILQVVTDVCKEDITVHSGDGRLVHQAKASMLELASNCSIKIRKLVLANVVMSATEDSLHLNSGILLGVLDTLEVLEIIDSDENWTEEDCANVLKFIEKCAWIKMACVNVSQQQPLVDKEVAARLQESGKTVIWITGSDQRQLLDTTTGEWMIENNLPVTEVESIDDFGWGEELILEAEEKISTRGGSVEIPDTGVKMDIPAQDLPEEVHRGNICMKIIPPDVSDWSITDLVSNSSVVVELLPNNARFQKPFKLTLPHCLQLKEGAQHKARIFVSHHKEGTYPRWEEKTDASYELTDTTCTIQLDSFCWVKYVIDGKTVEAQRVQVFAAGRHMLPSDTVYETEVGFYPDTPGGGEKFRSDKRLNLACKKTILLYKEGRQPLKFHLQQIVPSEWVYISGGAKSKEIPFEFIDESKESSCPFIFARQSDKPLVPRFMFRASQGDRGVRLLYRPKVQEDVSAYTQTD